MSRIVALAVVAVMSMAGPCLSFVTPPPVMLHSSASTSGTARSCVRRATAPAPGMKPSVNFDLRGQTAKAVTALGVSRSSSTVLRASEDGAGERAVLPEPVPPVPPAESNLPFYLDPTTRGGAVVVPILSLLLPLGAYGLLTSLGVEGTKAGSWVGVGYTMIGLVAWVGSYFFRVATKNMTYAVQLKNYEQAVIEKRFSELEEEEVDALLDEVNES